MTARTGYFGIDYGDTYEEVFSKVSANETIIENSQDQIVAVGIWSLTGDCRKMVFSFMEDHGLQEVGFEPAPAEFVENDCKQGSE